MRGNHGHILFVFWLQQGWALRQSSKIRKSTVWNESEESKIPALIPKSWKKFARQDFGHRRWKNKSSVVALNCLFDTKMHSDHLLQLTGVWTYRRGKQSLGSFLKAAEGYTYNYNRFYLCMSLYLVLNTNSLFVDSDSEPNDLRVVIHLTNLGMQSIKQLPYSRVY